MQLDTLDTATLNKLIQNKINFSIKTENFIDDVAYIEELIEKNGFTCRVYTENRAVGIGVGLFGNVGRLMSVYTAIGIGIHNLLTYNPDFEIGKDFINSRINVTYKK
ncbi:hypothetical protein [Gallibacterium anatis]|uniref:hypothetical protein n=1 Tax=Gallibacterium anatis TaxID=750 RepID=UPI000BA00871|nr:hypothetical protein [Gallibacterium anatis]WAX70953.1 hypothetical protein CF557_09090 [Gallibacterium anatis]